MTLWLHEHETYLLEHIRLEGHGDYAFRETCQGHNECTYEPVYRCQDCFGTELYCQECTVNRHRENPLHKIEFWNGSFFEDTTLKSLGLRVQLGHPVGERCFNHSRAYDDDFVILDINGIHELALDFCSCESALSHVKQLLRARWYPATSADPKSAATFRLLQNFHMLTFESKVSAFEYWQTLARLTDNTGIKPCKDRYDSLLRMIKQWRNLKLLKRFGRGHDPAGIKATEQGACTVVSLPDKRWLYAQFLAIDANFRLAHKNVSSDRIDPGLSRGWSYFVEEKGFKEFLADVGKVPQEKSACASHNAVNLAETKNSRGLAVTGAGTVDCSRHNFKRPCGVDVLVLNVSYDIACQWSKNLWGRMSNYPSRVHFARDGKILTFLILKFHLPAHITACQITFSHNFIKGMGRMDGEAPERGWANINPVATSTRETGPGARQDTLDDHFGDYNWKKVTNFGVSLLSKIKTTVPERDRHQRDFDDFHLMIIEERPGEVAQWKEDIENWEADTSNKNPFETTTITLTQAAVRLRLSQKEAEDLERGFNNSLHTKISPSVLISSGINLEEQHGHPTDLQLTKLQERSNALLRKIEQWCKVQLLYMPAVGRLRALADAQSAREEKAYDIKLFLPSKLKEAAEMSCDEQLCEYEWELWRAQAHEALDDAHWQLRLCTHLYKFKDAHIRGQRANTRASSVLAKVEQTIRTAAARYRRAWAAVKTLSAVMDKPNWEVELPELLAADIRGMSEGDFGQSEGNRTLSWIWKAWGAVLSEGKHLRHQLYGIVLTYLAALRIEWRKSRARANRWAEEVELLQEEMQRVARWWEEQANRRTVLAAPEQEGIEGYAKRQAALRRAMQDRFQKMWSVVPALLQSTSPAISLSVS
ncbi:hypothetical protein F4604DRAFT_1884427 [Suillus subluteus]|nr:hypothetical protein F4604DRAFT_1884427 [Suillus subluteus]